MITPILIDFFSITSPTPSSTVAPARTSALTHARTWSEICAVIIWTHSSFPVFDDGTFINFTIIK
ncbi:hypothetical protein E6Q11_04960 [Candidatus Dojkabacteria bacterium]|uniref:Uncharacterized protein n=1 Tax=Candidatus Dojkabacteria bacterium TaxID=2099670 RepID=A0A5C7J5V2_9BACT|nr:MAG: hypothetical protein E6Q11_04960 [Candidatus Dojkabacteria bacterium]